MHCDVRNAGKPYLAVTHLWPFIGFAFIEICVIMGSRYFDEIIMKVKTIVQKKKAMIKEMIKGVVCLLICTI